MHISIYITLASTPLANSSAMKLRCNFGKSIAMFHMKIIYRYMTFGYRTCFLSYSILLSFNLYKDFNSMVFRTSPSPMFMLAAWSQWYYNRTPPMWLVENFGDIRILTFFSKFLRHSIFFQFCLITNTIRCNLTILISRMLFMYMSSDHR